MTLPHLAAATEAGALVFLSGQLPFDANRTLAATDIAGQTTQVMKNIEAVLSSAGLDLSHIVKTSVWLCDAADFAGFNDAYAACLGDHRPARSTVVSQLVVPGALVEIEAIARRP
jgi:2-iminobutanoate/2-iminopropanoate deaminase